MWSIMVADDEPKIRRGLCRLIEKSGLPLELCANAEDGAVALQLLCKHRPDIVLLDVCMPHMNGLEFLLEARKQGIKSKFIVITGFDDFSFAQQSVSLKAFAYLLKPINEQELLGNLRAAIIELESENIESRKSKQALAQLETNQSLLRHAFEQKWLSGQINADDWAEQAVFWGVTFPKQAYLTLIKPDFSLANIPYGHEKPLILFGISNIAEEMLEMYDVCFCGCSDKGACAIISSKSPDESVINGITDTIQFHFKLQCQISYIDIEKPTDLSNCIENMLEIFGENHHVNPMLDEIRYYIDQNYHNCDLSLINLANALNVSQPYVSRLMKTALSTTFVDYLTTKRMNEAIELMKNPNNKLSWISTNVGYSNQHYFSAVFKKYTGVSPSVYRGSKL